MAHIPIDHAIWDGKPTAGTDTNRSDPSRFAGLCRYGFACSVMRAGFRPGAVAVSSTVPGCSSA